MPHLTTDDGVRLYYEETGSGAPVVLVHEFADDVRGYEPQVRYFGRRYRCIAFNARGYPPSDVPEDPARYSQERARDDIRAVLDGLGIAKAHVVGISMGGFAVLHFGLSYPDRALSLVVAGCGYGAEPGKRQQFHDETAKTAELIAGAGMADRRRRPMRSARPGCSSRTRTRAAGPSSPPSSPSIRPWARPTRCAASRRAGPRSTI